MQALGAFLSNPWFVRVGRALVYFIAAGVSVIITAAGFLYLRQDTLGADLNTVRSTQQSRAADGEAFQTFITQRTTDISRDLERIRREQTDQGQDIARIMGILEVMRREQVADRQGGPRAAVLAPPPLSP